MFTLNDLELYFDIATITVNNLTYTLTKHEDLSGVLVAWVSDAYVIYATPYYEGIPVPVSVIDTDYDEIGSDGYTAEIRDFERYKKIVETLAAKIIRRAKN
jgi:hypothetical protein